MFAPSGQPIGVKAAGADLRFIRGIGAAVLRVFA